MVYSRVLAAIILGILESELSAVGLDGSFTYIIGVITTWKTHGSLH